MSRKSVAILEKPVAKTPEKQTCCHHWIIEPALGPTSEGTCKLCGAKKTFLNVVEEAVSKSNITKLFAPEESSHNGKEEDDEEEDGD
jgi:hypothetical protein